MIHNNPVELLVEIQRISHQPARAVYEYSALLNTMKRCLNLKQADKGSLSDYQERFKQERNAMKAAMGTRFLDDFVELTDEYLSTTDADVHEKMKKQAVDKLMAVMFLENADRRIYGELIDSYVLDFANNNNLYPKTISSAIHVMSKVKPKKEKMNSGGSNRNNYNGGRGSAGGASFAQQGRGNGNNNRNNDQPWRCYCCGKENDHFANTCPKRNEISSCQWWNRTGICHFQSGNEGNEDDQDEDQSIRSEVTNQSSRGSRSERAGWVGAQMCRSFSQKAYDLKTKILLDSGTTHNGLSNPNLGYDIQKAKQPVRQETNSGSTVIDLDCKFPGVKGRVLMNPSGMANCFSLALLSDECRITMDTAKENAIVVHHENGIIKFRRDNMNLYTCDLTAEFYNKLEKLKQKFPSAIEPEPSGAVDGVKTFASRKAVSDASIAGVKSDENVRNMIENGNFGSLVVAKSNLQTLKNRMEGYSKKQVDGANKAMRLYHLLRVPQIDDAKMVLRQNLIKDCRVTNEEMNDAKAIYSKSSVSKSKGLTTKKKPGKVVEDFIEIPPELYLRNSQVVLAIDVFYVNQCAFLSTIDTSVRYRTAVPIDNETDEAYFDALNDVARIYNGADFKIRMIKCDGAFESIMEQVQDEMDIEMDYCPPNGHVPEAERNNRSIQDRTRAGFYRLPYPVIPKLMIQYLVMTCAGSFNWVPPKGGISKFYSPYMIMSHQGLDMNKHFQYELGAYVQVYAETQPTNTNRPRTLDCIYLSPDWNNLNGGHRVMDLNTGKEIRRHKIVCELPITE